VETETSRGDCRNPLSPSALRTESLLKKTILRGVRTGSLPERLGGHRCRICAPGERPESADRRAAFSQMRPGSDRRCHLGRSRRLSPGRSGLLLRFGCSVHQRNVNHAPLAAREKDRGATVPRSFPLFPDSRCRCAAFMTISSDAERQHPRPGPTARASVVVGRGGPQGPLALARAHSAFTMRSYSAAMRSATSDSGT
jgi:hypothetical protein